METHSRLKGTAAPFCPNKTWTVILYIPARISRGLKWTAQRHNRSTGRVKSAV